MPCKNASSPRGIDCAAQTARNEARAEMKVSKHMGYTHYWRQKRPFTKQEWTTITAEAKRICAKAQRALYTGKEDFASSTKTEHTDYGFRVGFNEEYAWRTF